MRRVYLLPTSGNTLSDTVTKDLLTKSKECFFKREAFFFTIESFFGIIIPHSRPLFMKKIIILDQGKGRLANQLWNSVSIYAYCLEKGHKYLNMAFDYDDLFEFPSHFSFLKKLRKNKFFIKIRIYKYFQVLIRFIFRKNQVWSHQKPFYLPPTVRQEPSQKDLVFFNGWLFRNPDGMKKFHKEIREYFKPKKEIIDEANRIIAEARSVTSHVVGVHIRQGDYRTSPEWNEFYFSPEQVRNTLNQYLKISGRNASEVVFLICSDEKIDENIFDGLKVCISNGSILADLTALSMTDIIIGSDSTYGAYAAYYGNIPIVVFDKKEIDWKAVGSRGFNYDNKCTRVHM